MLTVKPDLEFIVWAKKWLSIVHQDQSEFKEKKLKSQQNSLEMVENRLNKLLDLRLNDLIDDENYKIKKAALEEEKREIKNKLEDTNDSLNDGRMKIESTLDYAYTCQKRFEEGLREVKQEILMNIGSNLYLNTDKSLDIRLKKEFELLAKKGDWELLYTGWLEPAEYTYIMVKNPDLRPANPIWLPRVDSNHGPIA